MLEDDLRHSEKNEQALERSANQLRPTIRRLFREVLEMDDKELVELRDMLKAIKKERARRDERKDGGITEAIRMIVVGGMGAAGTWFAAHFLSGGKP